MAEQKLDQKSETRSVQIPRPNMHVAVFKVHGTSPLVIHRFSEKTKNQMERKMIEGKSAGSKKNREAKQSEDTFNEGRYIAKEGWDGFHAAAIRCAMISACRLVNFKMTLAKMSIFVVADGRDAKEPQIPLIRIHGKPVMQKDMARVETGQPYVTILPAYHEWSANIRIRWDADQFSLTDITNLLTRVGMQVGVGEGRPDSKNSCGMDWGLFEVEEKEPSQKGVAADSMRDPLVIKELKRIAAQNRGVLLPETIVAEARPKSSVLHDQFDWDDSEAAEKWRIHQARLLLNIVVEYIGPEDEGQETRVFVSLREDRGEEGGYRLMTKVLSTRPLREQLLEDAVAEMQHFKDKYRELKELAEVFAAMDSVLVKK